MGIKNNKKERKLALSEEILLKIEKPARYIGGEYNSVDKSDLIKENKEVTRVAMCFPDVYAGGLKTTIYSGLMRK